MSLLKFDCGIYLVCKTLKVFSSLKALIASTNFGSLKIFCIRRKHLMYFVRKEKSKCVCEGETLLTFFEQTKFPNKPTSSKLLRFSQTSGLRPRIVGCSDKFVHVSTIPNPWLRAHYLICLVFVTFIIPVIFIDWILIHLEISIGASFYVREWQCERNSLLIFKIN